MTHIHVLEAAVLPWPGGRRVVASVYGLARRFRPSRRLPYATAGVTAASCSTRAAPQLHDMLGLDSRLRYFTSRARRDLFGLTRKCSLR